MLRLPMHAFQSGHPQATTPVDSRQEHKAAQSQEGSSGATNLRMHGAQSEFSDPSHGALQTGTFPRCADAWYQAPCHWLLLLSRPHAAPLLTMTLGSRAATGRTAVARPARSRGIHTHRVSAPRYRAAPALPDVLSCSCYRSCLRCSC